MTAVKASSPRRRLLAAAAVASASLVTLLSGAVAPRAAAAVEWRSEVLSAPTNLPPGGRGIVQVIGSNVGDTDAPTMPTVSFQLPEGVTLASPPPNWGWSCSGAGSPEMVTCNNMLGGFLGVARGTFVNIFGGATAYVNAIVEVAPGAAEGAFPLDVTFEGSGSTVTQTHQLRIDDEQLPFGPTPGSFEAGAFDENGGDDTRAGGHPDEATTSFELNSRFRDPEDHPDEGAEAFSRTVRGAGEIKDTIVDLPAGFVGSPTAVPTCRSLVLVAKENCPRASQVGIVSISPPAATAGRFRVAGVFNVAPPSDAPAQLAFHTPAGNVVLKPVLRSDGDLGLSVQALNTTQIDVVIFAKVTLWGVPADPSHDALRCTRPNFVVGACNGKDELGHEYAVGHTVTQPQLPAASPVTPRPFLTNPTECTGQPVVTTAHFSEHGSGAPFEADGDPDLSDPRWKSIEAEAPPLSGCEKLPFDPTIAVQTTTTQANSPTGLHVELEVPQTDNPGGLATAHLRDTSVLLPEGMSINPSSVSGLAACTSQQIGLTSKDPVRFDKVEPSCPLSSKIGTVAIDTPLLEDPLQGDVYLSRQFDNPFDSLLGIYMVVRGPGLIVKLAGHVETSASGRLRTTVTDNPQVPFEKLTLDLKQGPRAPLMTPGCGTHTTEATLNSWAMPNADVVVTDAYAITQGPGGRPCPSGLLDPKLSAGVTNPIAGDSSPFVLNLSREDGTGVFTGIDVKAPEGLVAKLKGVPYCPEAALSSFPVPARAGTGVGELTVPACPAASQVGSVTVGAGAGSDPFYPLGASGASGRVYLAGPYMGAPLSLAIVTPAVAGPFDLGTVAVRSAIAVDPRSAQVTVKSDPIPTALQGIPLNIRDIRVNVSRPDFMQNPTDCSQMSVGATVRGENGSSAAVSAPFRVGACAALGFKPKLSLRLIGPTHRSAHPKLRATLTARKGDANIGRAQVTLPKTEFLENAHIETTCTRVQYAAKACPAKSVYGYAKAWSPLLDQPLQGPVYLRSSSNPLPDLVASLDGQIHIDLVGRIDSVNARIRNTFESVPDAPVSKFVLTMQGGRKGLLVNNTELCKTTPRATLRFGAQNGRAYHTNPVVKADCGKAGKKSKK